MWPIQLAFRLLISCRIFLCFLTLSNTALNIYRSDRTCRTKIVPQKGNTFYVHCIFLAIFKVLYCT
jgi:hypothetical protein